MRHEHRSILATAGDPETNPPWIPRDDCAHRKKKREFKIMFDKIVIIINFIKSEPLIMSFKSYVRQNAQSISAAYQRTMVVSRKRIYVIEL